MESQCPFNWRSLIGVLLANLDHCLQTLLGHQHPVQTQEGLFESLAEILAGLELWLFPKFPFEEFLAELGTLKPTVAIEHCKEADAFRKIWVGNMRILL